MLTFPLSSEVTKSSFNLFSALTISNLNVVLFFVFASHISLFLQIQTFLFHLLVFSRAVLINLKRLFLSISLPYHFHFTTVKVFQHTNVKLGFCTDLKSLPLFVISLAPMCNLCPDLKSLCLDLKSLPRFVIFLPRFEIP